MPSVVDVIRAKLVSSAASSKSSLPPWFPSFRDKLRNNLQYQQTESSAVLAENVLIKYLSLVGNKPLLELVPIFEGLISYSFRERSKYCYPNCFGGEQENAREMSCCYDDALREYVQSIVNSNSKEEVTFICHSINDNMLFDGLMSLISKALKQV